MKRIDVKLKGNGCIILINSKVNNGMHFSEEIFGKEDTFNVNLLLCR